MNHLLQAAAGCLAIMLAIPPATVTAENEGLADLDKATAKKLAVRDLSDLSQAIDLFQAALNKGLDEQNTAFAQQLLAEALMERATVLTEGLARRDLRAARAPPVRLWNIALSDLKRVLQLEASRPRAHYLMGRLHALAGNRAQAIEALDTAVSSAGEDQTALLATALTLRGTLQLDTEKRRSDLDRAVALAPDRAEAFRARALLLREQGKHDEALADLNQALELDPDDAATYEARGSALASKQDYDAAVKSLDKAIELAPKSASAYAQRGQVQLRKNQPELALADLDKAVELNPRANVVLLLRAHVRLLTGNKETALADVEKALRLQPGFLPALRLRGEILASSEQFKEAIGSLRPVASVRPKDSDLQLQLGRYYLADRQVQEAIAAFQRSLDAKAENVDALRLRGDAYLAVGQQAEAIVDYEAALKLEPEESGLLNNLAWVLATSPDQRLRDGQRALELATKACEVTDFKEPHIISTLAAAYAETGQFQTAVEWSEKAVDLGKDTSHIAQLRKELESYRNQAPWRELQSPNQEPTDDQSPPPQPDEEDLPLPKTPAEERVDVTTGFDQPQHIDERP